MKNVIFLLALSFCMINNVVAQPKGSPHHLMVTFITGGDAYSLTPQTIVTREDGTQQMTKADKKSWMNGNDFNHGRFAPNEDSLFLALKPFFDAGWNLTTTSTFQWASGDFVSRYFFTKAD